MIKVLETVRMGKVFLGLALVASLFMAVPAKAEIIRHTQFHALVPIFQIEFDGTDVRNWSASLTGLSDWNDLFYQDYEVGVIRGTSEFRNILYTWLSGEGEHHFHDFAVSMYDGDIAKLEINDIPVGLLPGAGNYFYNLEWLLNRDGELAFNFGDNPGQTFVFTFYGMTQPIPEPATLAILGLGLAGLGIARQRVKR